MRSVAAVLLGLALLGACSDDADESAPTDSTRSIPDATTAAPRFGDVGARYTCGPTDQAWVEVTLTVGSRTSVAAELTVADEDFGRSEPTEVGPGASTVGFAAELTEAAFDVGEGVVTVRAVDGSATTTSVILRLPAGVSCG